jgi:hypothetical protein
LIGKEPHDVKLIGKEPHDVKLIGKEPHDVKLIDKEPHDDRERPLKWKWDPNLLLSFSGHVIPSRTME